MKVAITSRLKEVIQKFITDEIPNLKANQIQKSGEGGHSSSSPTTVVDGSNDDWDLIQERMEEEFKTGYLSTNSFQRLVEYNQKMAFPPFFSSFNEVELQASQGPLKIEEESEKVKEEKAKRREYLKLRQEEREYKAMVGSSLAANEDESNANFFNSLKYQLTISFNMISAIFASFGIGYYISKQLDYSSSKCMIVGLAAAILMMIVEMVLFISRAVKAEELTENKGQNQKGSTNPLKSLSSLSVPTSSSLIQATDPLNKKND